MEDKKKNNIWWILGSVGLIILLLLGSYIAFINSNIIDPNVETEVTDTFVNETLENSPEQTQYIYYASLAKGYIKDMQTIVENAPEMSIDEILTEVDNLEYRINTTLDEFPTDSDDPIISTYKEMFEILSEGASNVYATVDTGDIEGGTELIENNIYQYNQLVPKVEPYYSEASENL